MLTQKVIIEVIKSGKLLTKNPSDSFLIINEFNAIDRSKNYTWEFQKTMNYWTKGNWKVVARDVQDAIRQYKAKC